MIKAKSENILELCAKLVKDRTELPYFAQVLVGGFSLALFLRVFGSSFSGNLLWVAIVLAITLSYLILEASNFALKLLSNWHQKREKEEAEKEETLIRNDDTKNVKSSLSQNSSQQLTVITSVNTSYNNIKLEDKSIILPYKSEKGTLVLVNKNKKDWFLQPLISLKISALATQEVSLFSSISDVVLQKLCLK